MPSVQTLQTEAIFDHHVQALMARDLTALLEDYSEDSVLITNVVPGAIRGLDALRGYWSQNLEMMTPEILSTVRFQHQEIAGDVAYVVWTAGIFFPFATDTLVIRDGKIATHVVTALTGSAG